MSAVAAISFPALDPVAIQIGPFALRWYALAYIAGFLIGWRWCVFLAKRPPALIGPVHFDNFLTWAIVGTILGGRLGFVLFYQPAHYLANPLDILKVWQGGMAFHGGFLGVVAAMILYARKHGLPLLGLTDLVAAAAPIGIFFGRVANFINGELWGRPSDAPWAVIFPRAGDVPRHPSQLYEALLEGLLLFAAIAVAILAFRALTRPGLVTGLFLAGYGAGRILAEFFREPDAQLGFLFAGATMGQLLSLPMLLGGIGLIVWVLRRPAAADAPTR